MTLLDEDDDLRALRRAGAGDPDALRGVLERHTERLLRMVRLRMDERLRGRLDAMDVVQEGLAEAAVRLPEYLGQPRIAPWLWLRLLVRERLVDAYRHHLGAHKRDPGREVALLLSAPANTSEIAREVTAGMDGPPTAAMRAETRAQVERVLSAMDPIDREILVLRHFEQLGNAEAAQELSIDAAAASKRYVRALERFGAALKRA